MAITYSMWKPHLDYVRMCYPEYKQNVTLDNYIEALMEARAKFAAPQNARAAEREANLFRVARTVNAAEIAWYKTQKPYYNVYPDLAVTLTRTKLEQIPAKLLEMPDGYAVVSINLPVDHQLQEFKFAAQAGNLQTIIGFLAYLIDDDDGNGRRIAMFFLTKETAAFNLRQIQTKNLDHFSVPPHFSLPLMHDASLEECVKELGDYATATLEKHPSDDIWRVARNALRLLISIGFMKNSSPELFEYDVLAKYLKEYRTAPENTRRAIEHRSRHKGKVGYNVGNEQMFISPGWKPSTTSSGDGSRELQWAHIRGGHPHAVRYGKNRENVKIVWFRSTVVRSDKPFKAE